MESCKGKTPIIEPTMSLKDGGVTVAGLVVVGAW